MKRLSPLIIVYLSSFLNLNAQGLDEDQLGAWYMYFWNITFGDSNWGLQGDYQYRDWQVLGDREQLLLRTGVTYEPINSGVKFTLGYANISTGQFGVGIDDPVSENRMYQEALASQKILTRLLISHRFRYEQRWVQEQDFRTRFRYNVFVNIPVNDTTLSRRTVYFAFYNEIFINGERDIGDNRTVQLFDRNRTYLGIGYTLHKNIRFQLGWMSQTTVNWKKGQLQFSMHHTF